jgi:hypothetical protein
MLFTLMFILITSTSDRMTGLNDIDKRRLESKVTAR